MVEVDAALASQIRNIESTYGRTVREWFAVIDGSGLSKHNEVVAMLKADHGLQHGAAHRLSLLARHRPTAPTGEPVVGPPNEDALYAGRKVSLRPLHDQLMVIVRALGDVEVAPKKGYLSLRHRKQFAMIQPSTATRIDLGLVLPSGTPVTARLESATGFNALFTHRIRVTRADDIDAQLRGWLHEAYAAAG
jgi:hypothetical protein